MEIEDKTLSSAFDLFEDRLFKQYPQTVARNLKTQISYYNTHLFACVSLARVKKKSQMPQPYFVLTLGLPYSLESERVAVTVEAYPGRWTTHIPISSEKDLDAELFSWLHDAYLFASVK